MATLYVTEYSQVGLDGIAVEPPNAEQTVTVAAASNQSSAFASNTFFVRLNSDTTTAVTFGSNPTATAAKARLPAGVDRIVRVVPGWKVANFQTT